MILCHPYAIQPSLPAYNLIEYIILQIVYY